MDYPSHEIARRTLVALLVAVLAGCLLALSPAAGEQASAATSAVPLKVQASKTYPIVYKLKGGKQASGQVKKVGEGKTLSVSKLKVPTRDGYEFVKWCSDKALKKKAKSLYGVKAKSKRTVYAKWKAVTYTIDYELGGGELKGSYATSYKTTKKASLPLPSRSGYSFAGWYEDAEFTEPVSSIAKGSTGDKLLFAKWEPVVYSVAYLLDGGTFAGEYRASYSAENPIEELPVPVKAGYSFIGWYSDSALTQIASSIPAESRGTVMLYARWVPRVLVAHRGLREEAPENSVAALLAAAGKGLSEVECDVRFSSDGVPVLVHDDTVPVVKSDSDGSKTTEKVAVSSLTYEELQSVELARKQSGTGGRNLATLDEALAACAKTDLRVTLHMKEAENSQVDTMMSLVRKHGMWDRVLWLGNSIVPLRYVKSVDPTVDIGYCHSITASAVKSLAALVAQGSGDYYICATRSAVGADEIALCKALGVPIHVWGFADETEMAGLDPYISGVIIDNILADKAPSPVEF